MTSEQVEELFSAAAGITDPARRAAYLDGGCGADASLRRRVDVLLASHDVQDSLLEAPGLQATVSASAPPLTERPGTLVGRYKLLQLIGEGGFAQSSWPSRTTPSAAPSP